jgi:glutathione synthase/RimK-type ligase-like ATP-grasp enzyme
MTVRVGILAREEAEWTPFGKQTIFFEEMATASSDLPVQLFVFSPMRWEAGSAEVAGYEYAEGIWQEVVRPMPDVLYDRFTAKAPGEKAQYLKIMDFLIARKSAFTTPPEMVAFLKNKVQFHHYLESHGIPTLPATLLGALTPQALEAYGVYHPTLYIKPVTGSNGAGIAILELQGTQGILRVANEQAVEIPQSACLEYLKAHFDGAEYFVQPKARMIRYEDHPYDIRVLIQNRGQNRYQITGQGVRIGDPANWVSNLSAGGSAKPVEILQEAVARCGLDYAAQLAQMEKICFDCTRLLHERFGDFAEIAFDILLTEDRGPIVLEANGKPARRIFILLARNFPEGSARHEAFKNLRRQSVRGPMVFIANTWLGNETRS